ncbi:MAG TPA: PEP-CTERM sorting domain-containing protein [Tepidisphaeraceae bacterium]|nr:PEP-CTERM sorting domain-containing protein [Tepidisphaeraceae bacterium]
MRHLKGLRVALVGGALGLLATAGMSYGQLVNGNFSDPTNTGGGTDPNATGWTLLQTIQTNGSNGNAGLRCTFHQPNGDWALWIQTFEATGGATQVVNGITAGETYTFSALWAFELGPATGGNPAANGYNNIPGMYSYMQLQFQGPHGNLGSPFETDIPSGSVDPSMNADAFPATPAAPNTAPWIPYSVTGLAPAGATSVEVVFGWAGGGSDSNTGSQSAVVTNAALSVPEPASLGLLSIGALGLLRRRRSA